MGCKLLFKDFGLRLLGEANLHPPHFYTTEFTSPKTSQISAVHFVEQIRGKYKRLQRTKRVG